MTKSPKAIVIPFDNLTHKEQIELFLMLFDFAHIKLPKDKDLPLILIPYKELMKNNNK